MNPYFTRPIKHDFMTATYPFVCQFCKEQARSPRKGKSVRSCSRVECQAKSKRLSYLRRKARGK